MKFTLKEIAEVVGAKNDIASWEKITIGNVEFDSRKVTEGSLFVPLQGARDGHDFISQANQQGAAATFWSQTKAPVESIPYLQVSDVLEAMQKLASYAIKKSGVKVVAITGSNGKTTTKDFTAAVLSGKYQVHKTQGNFNNHIGLPYTVLQMSENTEVLVLEMGMDHFGEIQKLSNIASPEVAAITMIGESHLEHLGSREGIAKAKMEIISGMDASGTLVLPCDEPLLDAYKKEISQKVITFGIDGGDYQVAQVKSDKEQATFRVPALNDAAFLIPIPGVYNIKNALIAIVIGHLFGVPVEKMQSQLATAALTQNRTQWLKGKNGIEIFSDVYNANPTAMTLALENFASMPHKETGNRMAVLGDMLDLGPDSREFHEGIGDYLNPEEIQKVFLYGAEMQALYEKLQQKYQPEDLYYFEKTEQEALITCLESVLKSTDMVMLKGSNGMGLAKVVNALVENE